ncbi:MAG: hypothetical protein L0211_14885 [Planctomycetaceae bacterium]|nr:hypothetical protein [Planctomycetaceae bacterium]
MKKAKSAKDSGPPVATPRAGLAAAIGLAVLTASYLIWFMLSPRRLELLRLLQDPFGLVAQWFGPAGTPLGLLDRVPVVAMAALILIAAYGLGRPVIRQLRLAAECTPLELTIFELAVGLSGLSTIVLVIGLAGWLRQTWLLWLVVFALVTSAVWHVFRDRRSRNATKGAAYRSAHSALVWLAVPFVVILLLGACLPPWDFDVREYHLQVPKEWLAQGQITFLPHNVYGNMPLAAEMHALLAMGLWPGENGWFYGALAGKVVIAAFTVLAALAIYSAGERLAGRAGGTIAAVVFISHPWVVHVSVSGLNDGVLACYVFLAFYSMWLARRGACSFLLPGLLAGAAAAIKYPGLAFAVAPLAVWALIRVGRISNPSQSAAFDHSSFAADGMQFRPTVAIALFVTGVLLGGGAWYVKSAVLTGNPVYPLAYNLFDGATRTPEKDAQWRTAHQVPPDAQGRRYPPAQLASSLARIAGRDDLASPLVLPLLAAAAIAAVIARSSPTPHSALRTPHLVLPAALALILILAVWWLLSHRIDRFLLPAWPFAALPAALAATIEDRWWRWTLRLVLIVGMGYCLVAASSQMLGDNRWFVSLAQLRRDGPWPEGTPLRVKPGHQFLNKHVPPGQSVLLVGDAQPFDLDVQAYYNTCFDGCLLCDWMLCKTADERRQELASRHIAWVLVDWQELERYRSPGNYGYDPRFKPELLDELLSQGVLGQPQTVVPLAPGQPAAVELYPVPTGD